MFDTQNHTQSHTHILSLPIGYQPFEKSVVPDLEIEIPGTKVPVVQFFGGCKEGMYSCIQC